MITWRVFRESKLRFLLRYIQLQKLVVCSTLLHYGPLLNYDTGIPYCTSLDVIKGSSCGVKPTSTRVLRGSVLRGYLHCVSSQSF